MLVPPSLSVCFFFNDTATTEIYTLSLHDALPICISLGELGDLLSRELFVGPHQQESSVGERRERGGTARRSEEHTSELQSQSNLVCRLLLEKKKPEERHQLRSRRGVK